MMPHKDVLPQCAANLAVLESTQQNMTARMDDMGDDLKTIGKAVTKLTLQNEEIIVPTITELARCPSPECPLYRAHLENQKKTLETELGGKVQQTWFGSFIKSNLAKALLVVVVAAIMALANFLTGCEMHRTEGDGYVTESGFRRFIDRDLAAQPAVPGTVDTAEYNNAVQEELCYIIESVLGAGACNWSAAADRADGWTQLHTAIFDSAALTDDAISDVSADKLTDGFIDITNGSFTWEQRYDYLSFQEDIATLEFTLASMYSDVLTMNYTDDTFERNAWLSSTYLRVRTTNAAGTAGLAETRYSARGPQFNLGPGDDSAFNSAYLMQTSYSVSTTWTETGTDTDIYTSNSSFVLTGIPDTATIYKAWYVDSSGARAVIDMNVGDNGSGVRQLSDVAVFSYAASPPLSGSLVVEFNGASLVGD